MTKYKIIHDRPNCIGCAACASVCPKYWKMEDDGKSSIIGGKNEGEQEFLELESDFDCNMEAAESCPVNVIHIEVDGEKKI